MKARYAKGAVALAVVALAGAGATVAMGGEPGPTKSAPKWNVAYAGKSFNAELGDVAPISAKEGWAIGRTSADFDAPDRPLLLHRNGGKWEQAPLPKGGVKNLVQVEASGPDNVWVLGTTSSDSRKLVAYRWDGKTWAEMPAPSKQGFGTTSVLGPDDVWSLAGGGYAWHWDGKSWQKTQLPARLRKSPRAISGTGANDLWVVGYRDTKDGDSEPYTQPAAAHWNGTSWKSTKVPEYRFGEDVPEETADLTSITPISKNDAWAFGEHTFNHGEGGGSEPDDENILLHWNGSTWKRASTKAAEKVDLSANTPDGAGGLVMGRSWHMSKGGSLEKIAKHDPVPGRTGKVTDKDKTQKFYPETSVNVPGTHRVWSVGSIDVETQGDANFTKAAVLEFEAE